MVVSLLQPAILSDPAALTRLLSAIIVVMVVSLALLFLTVIIQKLHVERERRDEDRAGADLRAALAGGTPLAALRVDPSRRAERRALAHVLAAHPPTDGDDQLRAAPWFASLLRALQRELRHRHWGRRASAYETLGLLPVRALREPLLTAAARERHTHAYAACLHAIARHTRSDDEMRELAALLGSQHVLSGSFNESVFRAWIRRVCVDGDTATATAAARLTALLHSLRATPLLTYDAIAALGRDGPPAIVPTLAAFAATPGAGLGLRIACARAIGQLDPKHTALLRALGDPAWQVQAVAARYLRDDSCAVLAALEGLLTHANFNVRRNAALALRELGAAGAAVLRAAAGSTDRYAAAVARYSLETPGGNHG